MQLNTHDMVAVNPATMLAECDTAQDLEARNLQLNHLTQISSQLGYEIVDIAGFLDQMDQQSQGQISALQDLTREADRVLTSNGQVLDTIQTVSTATEETLQSVQTSVKFVRDNSGRSQEVAEWVNDLEDRTDQIGVTVDAVRKNNEMITNIAAQVNILAINAKIEASRAGDAGRGFAVVAEAINDLSKRTQTAAREIGNNIENLSNWVTLLHDETVEISRSAELILGQARETDNSLQSIEEKATAVNAQTAQILSEAAEVKNAVSSFAPNINRIGKSVAGTTTGIHDTHLRVENLISSSEQLVQGTVALGGQSTDKKFISFVTELSKKVGAIFEGALNAGKITTDALFDKNYRLIPGTNPEQYTTGFLKLTDAALPPLLEAALDFDPRVVFCAAIDINGYLPTHNKKFSHPQGADPDWNTANCRNRRIFDDRVGLKAGRNSEAFLMQVYRRDMGGGNFVMMKDLSVPVFVGARHWGGIRMGFKS
ncbi:methyl-accepting chemotaxis protein [Pseudophaeobacter sp. EL27]|uniref:methyl-accepting chemotaxis protein n=1 Tax=Pseudophaeobacter sp. EL27 TaxID=2107580 RepID=UPI000EFA7F95|nr:methyl-accepting chemotaxis protein [Pseudophaeobacter sp. EL27]